MPKVSIIIPIYGVEKYIARCAKSLFEQTFTDIEYIFVNDCTNDNSMTILKSIITEYPDRNVIIINKRQNEGLPQARKTGVEAATGDYILNIDSDDWIENNTVETLYAKATETRADMIVYDWIEEYEDQNIRFTQKSMTVEEYYESIICFKSYAYAWNRIAKRSLYRGLTFPCAFMLEDFVITTQLLSKTLTISYVNQPLYHYSRLNSGRSTDYSKYRSNMRDKVFNIMFIYKKMERSGDLTKHKFAADNMVMYMLAICLVNHINSLVGREIIIELAKKLKHIKISSKYTVSPLLQIAIKILYKSIYFRLINDKH